MKTFFFFFFLFWDLQFDSGHCKYDNTAVSHVYVDIKGGRCEATFSLHKKNSFYQGRNLRPRWREREVCLFALGLMIGRRQCGTVWRFRS